MHDERCCIIEMTNANLIEQKLWRMVMNAS